MSNFFIHRPVFAWVLAILISFFGLLALPNMSVEQYPDVAPPAITISATYPGASAEEVSSSMEEISTNSVDLRNLANELNNLLGQFKL